MKQLLLADANRLSESQSEYEATRQQIERAEYETFTLRESDFDDLVFMEANDSVWANNQKLVNTLTPKGKSRTLKEAETYQPVRVIFSKDWTHLYPWAQLTA